MPVVGEASPGVLLRLIRRGEATTRTALAEVTGLARSTIAQRTDVLLEEGLIYVAGEGTSTGGRPPVVFAFNQHLGVVLAADLGALHARLAVTDLAGTPLAEAAEPLDIAEGPDVVLPWLADRFGELLAECERRPDEVYGVGVGVPGPVEFSTGRPTVPPIMPGWDGVVIPARLRAHLDVPVFVDNDVNIMALGEYWTQWRECDHLLFVKVGTGIGCGIVLGRWIHRGAQGAAGDIGHIRVAGHEDVRCHCGRDGCLEAIAGGGVLARRLGLSAPSEVAELAERGDHDAADALLDAGRRIGDVLAGALNLFNPDIVVVGGAVARGDTPLLTGIRETAIPRAPALATRDLRVVPSALGDRSGVVGAAVTVIEEVLAPVAVDRSIAERGREVVTP